jgi:uncharacterized membrane protein YkoI
MHAKSLLLIVTLALVSLVGWGRPVAQAATQMTSPLSTGQNSAPAGPVCAPAPVLNPAKWGPPDPSLITPAKAQQIAEMHAQAGCAHQIKLDVEDCRLVYEIKIGWVKVEVDAKMGVVTDADYSDD